MIDKLLEHAMRELTAGVGAELEKAASDPRVSGCAARTIKLCLVIDVALEGTPLSFSTHVDMRRHADSYDEDGKYVGASQMSAQFLDATMGLGKVRH